MSGNFFEVTQAMFGIGQDDPALWQIALRALLVYLVAILLVKLGEKRFMGKSTAFDMVLGIMIGSILSRAIAGSDLSFFLTIGAGALLVALHWLLAVATFHSDWLGDLVKGQARTLVREGQIDWKAMRKSHISAKDLESALYSNGQLTEVGDVEIARFERSGEISVIPRRKQESKQQSPKVIEISVRDGVQTVRVELA